MKTLKPIVLGLAIIFVAGALVWFQNTSTSTSQATTQTTPATGGNGSYTLAEISKHPDATSCWAAINGSVYDLADWINKHPGGPDRILSICGKDGSAPFNAQHGGAALQQQILAGYKIGTLAN